MSHNLDKALRALPRIKQPKKPTIHPIRKTPEEIRSGRTCASKVKYPTAQDARNVANKNEAVEIGLKLYFYKCATCHRWHLTKKKP